MCCEVFRFSVIFPKRIKGIDNPVVFIKEECVNGRESRLDDSSGVPVVRSSWVGLPSLGGEAKPH